MGAGVPDAVQFRHPGAVVERLALPVRWRGRLVRRLVFVGQRFKGSKPRLDTEEQESPGQRRSSIRCLNATSLSAYRSVRSQTGGWSGLRLRANANSFGHGAETAFNAPPPGITAHFLRGTPSRTPPATGEREREKDHFRSIWTAPNPPLAAGWDRGFTVKNLFALLGPPCYISSPQGLW